MVVHSYIWVTSFCACVHAWASGVFLCYSPLPCLETESLTQLEAWYFFLTYWLVSFCNPLVSAQWCWNHIYARSCLALLLLFLCECRALNFGLHFCIQPVKIHLVSLETSAFPRKFVRNIIFIWKSSFAEKKFTSLFLEPEMILSPLVMTEAQLLKVLIF